MRMPKAHRRPRGISLVEVLVVMGVLGVLAAILLPAMSMARESARRVLCHKKLSELGTAVEGFAGSHSYLPANPAGFSIFVEILPWLEAQTVYDGFNLSGLADRSSGGPNATSLHTKLAVFSCPSDPAAPSDWGAGSSSSYAGNVGTGVPWFGWNGFFAVPWQRKPFRAESAKGLSKLAEMSEQLVANFDVRPSPRWEWNTAEDYRASDGVQAFAAACRGMPAGAAGPPLSSFRGMDWVSTIIGQTYYNHILPPNGNSCSNASYPDNGAWSACSLHPGVVGVLFGDGHLEPISETIDAQLWTGMGSATAL